jgi:O-antigen ligase
MMLVCTIVFLMKEIRETTDKKRKIILIICSCVLSAGLIQLGSKAVLIAFLLILNLAFPLMQLRGIPRKRFMFLSITATLLLMAFLFSVDIFRERFMVSLEADLVETNEIYKSNSRAERWDVAAEIIRQSPAIGNGTGSETVLLKDAYFSKKMYGSYLSSLNAHNQFLSLLISAGVIGLLLYLATLYWGFRRAIFNRDILGLSFMILVTIVSFSEDILYVNKGIFFYSFFFPFFLLKKTGLKYVFRETTSMPEYRLVK